jgi:hypothetical protein
MAIVCIRREGFDVLGDTRLIDVGNRLIQHRMYLTNIVGLNSPCLSESW